MNTAGNFDLSVIIPTYKRKDSLFTLLECLLRQQNVNLQIIVVDQNPPGYFSESEENIFAQVNKIWQEDPNASKARNIGFLNSSAPYVLFIDDDLIPEDDFCSKGVNIFYQNRNIGCYFPNVYNELGPEVSLRDASTKAIGNIGEVFEISDAISAAVFFERSYYEKSRGFNP
jgi:glycosyltransferase involved in cell wall biosynthesis